MVTISRSVTAVCVKREDAVSEIIRLLNKGYQQSDINVYSNSNRAKALGRLMGIEIQDLEIPETIDNQNWWDSFKTSFLNQKQLESIDNAESSTVATLTSLNNGARAKSIDCLNSYEKELASGKLVIVVDNYGSHSCRDYS